MQGHAKLLSQAFLEGGGLGVFELGADARVAQQALHKVVGQAIDAGLFAQRSIQTRWCGGSGYGSLCVGQICARKDQGEAQGKYFHGGFPRQKATWAER